MDVIQMKNCCRLVLLVLAASPWIGAQEVASWRTTQDLHDRLTPQAALHFSREAAEGERISVDPSARYQEMDGFGASMTDSSAWLLEEKLSPAARHAAMVKLFDARKGIGLSFLRQPLGASDLARNHYTYDDVAAGEQDPELKKFSVAHDEAYLFPALREALKVQPGIKLMGTPWSPPAWMKTNGSLKGGSLREDSHGAFAQYLVKSVEAYKKAGVPLGYLTVQNEALFAPDSYPGMVMTASEQKRFIAQALGPALKQAGIKLKLLAYDHNWDHPEYPIEVLDDAVARPYVAGSALHCYGGDVDGQLKVHEAHPEAGIWMTECSGGTWQEGNLLGVTARLIIESTRNWAKSVILWGLVLDQNNGPHAGGCGTCRGLATVDTSKTPAEVSYTVDYYAMGSASRFVRPGAVRIASSTGGRDGVESVAFENPDHSIALLLFNNRPSTSPVVIEFGDKRLFDHLPAGSFTTYLWHR